MENGLLRKRIAQHLEAASSLLKDAETQGLVEKAAAAIAAAYRKGGKTIFMGNGGSAADAQHMAAEFLGRYLLERKSLPSLALTANSSAVTAIANDYEYGRVFARQLQGLADRKDVVVGISTSGNSQNVVEALRYAKAAGIFSVALVGKKKCALDAIADVCIKAPGDSTPRIQEMHVLILHSVCEIVELELFG